MTAIDGYGDGDRVTEGVRCGRRREGNQRSEFCMADSDSMSEMIYGLGFYFYIKGVIN